MVVVSRLTDPFGDVRRKLDLDAAGQRGAAKPRIALSAKRYAGKSGIPLRSTSAKPSASSSCRMALST
jgi:hypothetical protein